MKCTTGQRLSYVKHQLTVSGAAITNDIAILLGETPFFRPGQSRGGKGYLSRT
jgi:hypothetical protein